MKRRRAAVFETQHENGATVRPVSAPSSPECAPVSAEFGLFRWELARLGSYPLDRLRACFRDNWPALPPNLRPDNAWTVIDSRPRPAARPAWVCLGGLRAPYRGAGSQAQGPERGSFDVFVGAASG